MKIGWIGTGVMGSSMCGQLLSAGNELVIYSRTKSKAEELLAQGAVWADSPSELAVQCSIIFTIVGYPEDVHQVYLGENGIFSAVQAGTYLIDMTTSEPSQAAALSVAAAQSGCSFLDAPVSGGDIGAREGTLAIMAGGDKQAFRHIEPYFKLMGKTISYMGPSGSGQHTKMCNQILIASTMIGVVESLIYASRSGLSPDEVIDVIGKGAASSWSINILGRRIASEDFSPGFYIKHFVKDMGIALKEAEKMNIALPGLALVYQFYQAALAQGLGENGTQGLYKVLQKLNSLGT